MGQGATNGTDPADRDRPGGVRAAAPCATDWGVPGLDAVSAGGYWWHQAEESVSDGRHDDAVAQLRLAAAAFWSVGDMRTATCKSLLGDVLLDVGRYDEARSALEEARALFLTVGQRADVADCDFSIGHLLAVTGQYDAARDRLDAAWRGYAAAGPEGEPMAAAHDPAHLYVPPNLTPDPETGHLEHWTEDSFVARFRAGATIPDTLMPWGAYGRFSDDDLRAIWRYLRALPPVRHATGPAVVPR